MHQILEADMIGDLPMRFSSRLMRACFVAALAVGAAACSDEEAPASVQVMHWWTAGGEKEAIDALLGEFEKRHPSIDIVNASVSGGSAKQRERLVTLFQEGPLPDTFQANGGWSLMAWVLYDPDDLGSTKLSQIDDLADDWRKAVPAEVLTSVSYPPDGLRHQYAVPLNIHRLNTLFYNKDLFARADVKPEDLTDVSQLFRAADKIREHTEVTMPIALGYGREGEWAMSLLFFENLLVGHRDGALYEDLFGKPAMFNPYDPEFVATLEDLRTLMSYANDDANTLPWDKAMARVLKGEAAMTIMGDWAKGYADADEEFRNAYGFIPMPGTANTFVFTTDTFSLPIKLEDKQVATTKELLRFFGSVDGQKIFNEKKGSISARTDVPLLDGDNRQATFDAFHDPAIKRIGATALLAPQTWVDAVSKALAAFATDWKTGNPSEVQHTIYNYRDLLMASCCLQ